ncbi:hypothetical protein BBP00_00009207 [Phytophthora kernoviae]|uniref:RxLR effector protein n=1 Tax=Phytophthora kernoviae TaxID=325452 RepID=A0A3F2RD99_9STRA|nr:hypothetical protein BBP00_00009207 [Phytophthora kernoviae]
MKASVIVTLVAAAVGMCGSVQAVNLRQHDTSRTLTTAEVSDGGSSDISTDASDSATSERFLEDIVDDSSFMTEGNSDDSSDEGSVTRILIETEITTGGSSVVDGGEDKNKISLSTDSSNNGSGDRFLEADFETGSDSSSSLDSFGSNEDDIKSRFLVEAEANVDGFVSIDASEDNSDSSGSSGDSDNDVYQSGTVKPALIDDYTDGSEGSLHRGKQSVRITWQYIFELYSSQKLSTLAIMTKLNVILSIVAVAVAITSLDTVNAAGLRANRFLSSTDASTSDSTDGDRFLFEVDSSESDEGSDFVDGARFLQEVEGSESTDGSDGSEGARFLSEVEGSESTDGSDGSEDARFLSEVEGSESTEDDSSESVDGDRFLMAAEGSDGSEGSDDARFLSEVDGSEDSDSGSA